MNIIEQKDIEEKRRNRHFDPVERWRAIQDAIAWADAQQKEPRNSRSNRIKEQREKNSLFLGFGK